MRRQTYAEAELSTARNLVNHVRHECQNARANARRHPLRAVAAALKARANYALVVNKVASFPAEETLSFTADQLKDARMLRENAAFMVWKLRKLDLQDHHASLDDQLFRDAQVVQREAAAADAREGSGA